MAGNAALRPAQSPPSSPISSFQFDPSFSGSKKDGIAKGVSFQGFVYSRSEFQVENETVIHGMLVIEKDEVENPGALFVFYDSNAASNISISNATVVAVEWREIPGYWPSGL